MGYEFHEKGSILVNIGLFFGVFIIVVGFLMITLKPIDMVYKHWDKQRKKDLVTIQQALNEYYKSTGVYPPSSALEHKITGINGETLEWGQPWMPYINILPKDPVGSKYYIYINPDPKTYFLYTSLDFKKDPELCQPNKIPSCSSVPDNVLCGNGEDDICNFGVSSPNVTP